MKLIYCRNCADMVAMASGVRSCQCGRSSGRDRADCITEIGGPCVVIDLSDVDLRNASNNPIGGVVETWVLPEHNRYIEREPERITATEITDRMRQAGLAK